MNLRYLILAAALLAAAPFAASAQQSTLPSVGSGKEANAVKNSGSTSPGGTGKTVVPGSKSTVAGDKAATTDAKTNMAGGSSGGGK
jgi:hypothetical protein